MRTLTIATRRSRLALWQAEHVQALLEQRFGFEVRLLGLTTRGDRILDRSLAQVGGKGLFVKELEEAMADGRADLAVHSLKDVPMQMPDGFRLAAVLEREDPRDAFVSNRFAALDDLPPGARVGTSSLRRSMQLLALRPDLHVEPVRGNLDTRLRKLDEGAFDALVLACAGLRRLGLASRIRAIFAADCMIPAAGQGALAVETRSIDDAPADDAEWLERVEALTHRPTWLAVHAERAVSRALGGNCTMPLAAHAEWNGATLVLDAALGADDDPARAPRRTRVQDVIEDDAGADALGARAAAALAG